MCEHKYFDNMLPRAVMVYSWFQTRSDGMSYLKKAVPELYPQLAD